MAVRVSVVDPNGAYFRTFLTTEYHHENEPKWEIPEEAFDGQPLKSKSK
jgi:hypothetical protein